MTGLRFNPYQVTLVALLPASGGFVKAETLAGHTALPVAQVREQLAPLVEANVVTFDADRDEYEIAED